MKHICSYFFILFVSSFSILNGEDKISAILPFPVDSLLKDIQSLEESYSLAVEAYRNDAVHIDEIVNSSYAKKAYFLKKYGKGTEYYKKIRNMALDKNYTKRNSFIFAYERLIDDLFLEEKSITGTDFTADYAEFIEYNPKFQIKKNPGILSFFKTKNKVFFCFTIQNVFFRFNNTIKKIESKNNLEIIKSMIKNPISISYPDQMTGEPNFTPILQDTLEDEESNVIREIYLTRALGNEQWDEIISTPWRKKIRISLCNDNLRESYSFPVPDNNSVFENGIYISYLDKIRIKKIIEKVKMKKPFLPTF